jgi:hypothetical protein
VKDRRGREPHRISGRRQRRLCVDVSADEVWPGAVAAISREFPTLPIVGYERGDDLRAAAEAGFEAIGRLRVWLQTEER